MDGNVIPVTETKTQEDFHCTANGAKKLSPPKIWRKTGNALESNVYELLGSHPRILPYFGVDARTKNILLPRLDNGDLWTHLAAHKNIPLKARITWAVEIAQGLAHLHAKHVVWADAHLRNILLTDDFHAVLCDFRFSIPKPSYFHSFSTCPPPVFMWPPLYYGKPPTRVDVFGFAIILYVLLENRFPFCRDLLPPLEEQVAAYKNHCSFVFDTLTDPSLNSFFGRVVAECFAASYTSGEELVKALGDAYESWSEELDAKGEKAHDIPYPEKPELIEIEPVPPSMYTYQVGEHSEDPTEYVSDTEEGNMDAIYDGDFEASFEGDFIDSD